MGLTGVAMETMRPSGPVKLESIESGLYKEVGGTVFLTIDKSLNIKLSSSKQLLQIGSPSHPFPG